MAGEVSQISLISCFSRGGEESEDAMAKRRTSRKGIVHSTREPKWKRDLNAWKKSTWRRVKNVMALAGAIWILMLVAEKLLGGG